MNTVFLRGCAVMLACTAVSANAASILNSYSVGWATPIATREASAIAYNWDQNRLMVTNDEETNNGDGTYYARFGEYDMSGNFLATITVRGCETTYDGRRCDPEGLTYIGNNSYVMAAERPQDIYRITSDSMDGDREYTSIAVAPQIDVGSNAGNSGLEGIAYNSITGEYFGVKERNSQLLYSVANVDWDAEAATVTNPFDVSALGLESLQDVAVLSNGIFAGTSAGENLLILSGTSQMILEVNLTGEVLGTFSLSDFNALIDPEGEGGKFEGITLDLDGNIYLVSDDGDGLNQSYIVKLQYNAPSPAVPEPATWALMMAGFGLVGAGLRRPRATVRFA
ncbi:hypothetical protein SLG_12270 [Sphingobium sp. SYK-6]|nr:SdiA-regulated domain-containing protein [Sphingobium sp. SYK-6]BAK65902.1 hypothetical protein SLG_12270 [Sphingobium sp. SYK-6]